jgi:hypothetical protein
VFTSLPLYVTIPLTVVVWRVVVMAPLAIKATQMSERVRSVEGEVGKLR